jgi:hypothetical protein
LPRRVCVTTFAAGSVPRTLATVSSTEPASTTTTSRTSAPTAAIRGSSALMVRASLQVGTTTDTPGSLLRPIARSPVTGRRPCSKRRFR